MVVALVMAEHCPIDGAVVGLPLPGQAPRPSSCVTSWLHNGFLFIDGRPFEYRESLEERFSWPSAVSRLKIEISAIN